MELWQAIVLGLVEGITEYLPVSSTGHLIIAGDLLKLDRRETKASLDAFCVIIQGGAILAVLALYFPRFLQMLKGLAGRDPAGFRIFVNIVVAFLPAALVGIVLKKDRRGRHRRWRCPRRHEPARARWLRRCHRNRR